MSRVTYSAGGVNLSRAYGVLKSLSKKGGISYFASVAYAHRNVGGPLKLAFSADGTGTKTELLRRLNLDWISGWDCVAMNANDLLCVGAQPRWFLDYYAQGRINQKTFDKVLFGMRKALAVVGAEMTGGETAELPGVFAGPEVYDVAGFLAGTIAKGVVLDPKTARPGDLVIGLASSGPHSNGFSLIRKALSWPEIRRWSKELLAPTRLYQSQIIRLLNNVRVRSLAHITGGGFVEKLPRAMGPACGAALRWGSWRVPPVFEYLRKKTGLNPRESCGVFNMGIGFVLIVDPAGWPALSQELANKGVVIGEIYRRKRAQPAVIIA